MVQLSHPYMTTGKTITLTRQTFVSKVMHLLFNTVSRFVIAFLPRNKRLLISWLQSLSSVIFGAQENKTCHCLHFFPFCLPWSDGTGFHDLSFPQCWVLSQLFHSHSPSSRSSSVPLCFLPLGWFFFFFFFSNFFLFIYLLAAACSMWDLSSLARDQTCAPCIGRCSLNH